MGSSLGVKCPACGAFPSEPCVRIDGTLLQTAHSKRKELAMGIKPALRIEHTSRKQQSA